MLEGLLPRLMVPVACQRAGIPPDLPVNALTKGQRRRLLETLKAFSIPLAGPRPGEGGHHHRRRREGRRGGPRAPWQSKKAPGLFLAGELLDVDAYTGGFNLQIAWCTGRAAGEGAAARIARRRRTELWNPNFIALPSTAPPAPGRAPWRKHWRPGAGLFVCGHRRDLPHRRPVRGLRPAADRGDKAQVLIRSAGDPDRHGPMGRMACSTCCSTART